MPPASCTPNSSSGPYFLQPPTPLLLSFYYFIPHCAQLQIWYFNLSPFVVFGIQSVSSFASALCVSCILRLSVYSALSSASVSCLSNHPYHLLDLASSLFMFPFRLCSGFYLIYPSKPVTSVLSNLIVDAIHGDPGSLHVQYTTQGRRERETWSLNMSFSMLKFNPIVNNCLNRLV